MTRWLITVEHPDEHRGAPIAGIYVTAETKQEALQQVRRLLARAPLVAWNKGAVEDG